MKGLKERAGGSEQADVGKLGCVAWRWDGCDMVDCAETYQV